VDPIIFALLICFALSLLGILLLGKSLRIIGAGALALGTLMPVGKVEADFIEVGNISANSSQNQIGSGSAVINQYDHPSMTHGYDEGIDGLLIDTIGLNPLNQFFTMTQNLDGNAVTYNWTPLSQPNDTFTFGLSGLSKTGESFTAENYVIMFDTLNIDNPNGVVDYSWNLVVDTNMDGSYDHFDGGSSVKNLIDYNGGKTDSWSQYVKGNISPFNQSYGTLTLTAKPIPEPSSFMMLAGLGVMGAGATGVLGRRRKSRSF